MFLRSEISMNEKSNYQFLCDPFHFGCEAGSSISVNHTPSITSEDNEYYVICRNDDGLIDNHTSFD